jgi:hypothetical protein
MDFYLSKQNTNKWIRKWNFDWRDIFFIKKYVANNKIVFLKKQKIHQWEK